MIRKQKSNWRLLLVGAVLASVLIVAAFGITTIVFKRAKTLKWAAWTGFGETQVTTKTTKENDKTTVSRQIHSGKTLWDWLGLTALAGPILIAFFGYLFEQRAKREIAQNNSFEEAIQVYVDSIAKLFLDYDKSNFLDKDNPVPNIVRTRTITILRRLKGDTERQATILRFLRDAELYEFILKNANLEKANLEEANLKEANLEEANLKEANLEKANLEKANLEKANLEEANLEGANLEGANLKEANLKEANLEDKADLRVANLSRANLRGANLEKANLEKANLRGANLEKANLSRANLRGANLWEANLWGANLEKANLSRANLKEADLWEAKLRRANLEKADLWEANLWGAKLRGAKLRGANLSEADLSEADLRGANLEKANFTDAKNLTPKQIKSARFWEKAIYNKEDESLNQQYIQELKKDKYFALIFRSISSKYLYLISKLKRNNPVQK